MVKVMKIKGLMEFIKFLFKALLLMPFILIVYIICVITSSNIYFFSKINK